MLVDMPATPLFQADAFLRSASAAVILPALLGISADAQENDAPSAEPQPLALVFPVSSEPAPEEPLSADSMVDDFKNSGVTELTRNDGPLDLATGYYEFDEGAEGFLQRSRTGEELPRSHSLYFQSAMFQGNDEQDLPPGFVGLWASLPFGRGNDRGEPAPSPAENAIQTLTSPLQVRERHRTRRAAPETETQPVSAQPARNPLLRRLFGDNEDEESAAAPRNLRPVHAETAQEEANPRERRGILTRDDDKAFGRLRSFFNRRSRD